MSYQFIPTSVHGILDYLVAAALVLAPTLFDFTDIGGPAVYVPIALGVGLFLYSVLTNYEWGIIKVISMPVHLLIDLIAAAALVLSPFIFGFVNEAPNAWLPHIFVGLAIIFVVLFSKNQPGTIRVVQ